MLGFGKLGDFFRCWAGIEIKAVWAGPVPYGRGLNDHQGSVGVVCIVAEQSGRGRRYMGGVKRGIKAVWAWSGLEPELRGRGQDRNQGCVGVASDAGRVKNGIKAAWAGPGLESEKCGRGLDQNNLQYGRGHI